MVETTRGHRDNASTQQYIGRLLDFPEGEAVQNIVLVRLTGAEYDQMQGLPEGSRVAIFNLQHYDVHPDLQEFQIDKHQYGVRIRKPGRNTEVERIEPELDEASPIIALRLEGYRTDLKSEMPLDVEALEVDHIILGGSSSIGEFLANKYRVTMDVDLRNFQYYIRIFTILEMLHGETPDL